MTTMLKKFSGVFEKARRIEAAIASTVEGAAVRTIGTPAARQPLEVVHAVVETVARDIQPTGRGRHGFPFNLIRVSLLAPTPRVKAQLQAVVDGPEPLPQRIEARLRAAGCVADGLAITVAYVAKARPDWMQPDFDVQCLRTEVRVEPDGVPEPRLELAVVAGEATAPSYVFGASAVALGRGGDITDSRGRLIRVNHVIFVDGDDEASRTVSRLHAHIEHDPASGRYRLFDDGSAQGTSIIRHGRGHVVSRGGRGVVLQSGDEVVLGRARLAVTLAR